MNNTFQYSSFQISEKRSQHKIYTGPNQMAKSVDFVTNIQCNIQDLIADLINRQNKR